ncbi:hypothetical protein Ahy_B06g084854 isoform B [Arachis hypogaea]|uniref:Uncharacterized protein n=1 Tax=Arachis hypogaea TaxID=3818 RepID=A0A444YSX8_ARAHY|nr:hypothetical protein Ahy_B06g084854 isoform B [Arachis hypogaea]
MGSESPTNPNSISEGNRTVYPMSPPEIDKRTAEQKAIDDWLPITSSRNAKWWYSTFHNVTAMGSGCGYPDTVMGNNFVYAVANG